MLKNIIPPKQTQFLQNYSNDSPKNINTLRALFSFFTKVGEIDYINATINYNNDIFDSENNELLPLYGRVYDYNDIYFQPINYIAGDSVLTFNKGIIVLNDIFISIDENIVIDTTNNAHYFGNDNTIHTTNTELNLVVYYEYDNENPTDAKILLCTEAEYVANKNYMTKIWILSIEENLGVYTFIPKLELTNLESIYELPYWKNFYVDGGEFK